MLHKATSVATVLLALTLGSAHADEGAKPSQTVEKKKENPAEPPSEWAGSALGLSHFAVVAGTFGLEPDWNPTVGQILSFDARYKYSNTWTFRGHAEVVTELTNSDSTTREREPLFGDVSVGAARPVAHLPYELDGVFSLQLTLPTSRESRARERLFGLRPRFEVSRKLPLTKNVTWQPRAGLALSYVAATARTLTYDAPTIVTCAAEGGDCSEFMHSGSRSAIGSLTETLGANFQFPHALSGAVEVTWIQSLLYPVDEYTLPVTGEELEASDSNTNWRLAVAYTLALEWQAAERFSLGGGFQTMNAVQKADSSLQWPFFNRYTQVFVSTSVIF